MSEVDIVGARRDAWVFLRVDEDPPRVLPPLDHPAARLVSGPLYFREEARIAWLRLPSAGLEVGVQGRGRGCVSDDATGTATRRAMLPTERIDVRSETCGCCGPNGEARAGEACSLAAVAASMRDPPMLDPNEAAAFGGWHACLAVETARDAGMSTGSSTSAPDLVLVLPR